MFHCTGVAWTQKSDCSHDAHMTLVVNIKYGHVFDTWFYEMSPGTWKIYEIKSIHTSVKQISRLFPNIYLFLLELVFVSMKISNFYQLGSSASTLRRMRKKGSKYRMWLLQRNAGCTVFLLKGSLWLCFSFCTPDGLLEWNRCFQMRWENFWTRILSHWSYLQMSY